MIDGEISLKSLLYVAESLEQLIGGNGAKAVLRTAGARAAVNLIEMLPLTVPEDDAILRTGALLVELGFISALQQVDPDTLQISCGEFMKQVELLGLQGVQSTCYYVIGLFEGFFKQMSGSKLKVVSIETSQGMEIWKLG
jgi:predicted hydrocarbon binding protein